MTKEELLKEVKYDKNGLIPVIAQDYHSKKVRMLAYMNKEALEKTLDIGKVYYFSRSRNALWLKGDTSTHYQYLKAISIDCDNDTLLIQIEQIGGISCHTGNPTCFFRELTENADYVIEVKRELIKENMLTKLYKVILERKNNPKEGSYTNYLLDKGIDKILKKIGEETAEVIIASKSDNKADIVYEIADLMYHLSVLMASLDITWEDVEEELDKR